MSDISETLLGDLQAAGVDVTEWKRDVQVDPKAIDEVVAMFDIPEEEARTILAKHESSIERAMAELFERHEQAAAASKARAGQAQLERTTALLEKGFSSVDRSVIAEIVARHGGEIEAASNELLRVMAEQLERDEQAMMAQKTEQVEKKQQDEKKLRAQILAHCTAQFDVLTSEEVVEVLRKTNYDLPKSVGELREMSQARKLRNLAHMFSGVPMDHIRAALEDCNYDLSAAFALLSSGTKKDTPPPAEDASEAVLRQSILHINPDDQATKDLLANMLREKAGPGAQEADKKPASAVNRDELDAAGNSEQPAATLKVQLSVGTTMFRYGDSAEVTAAVTGGDPSSYDWIGLFNADDQSNANVLAWSWFKASKPTVSLVLPNYGHYEARYLRKVNGVVLALAKSETFHCGPVLKQLQLIRDADMWKAAWQWDERSEKIGSSAWFGLFLKDASDSNYLAFQYASAGSATSSILFNPRTINGEYEVRFFAHKFQRMATSAVVKVDGSDSVTMERVGDQVVVKTLLASVDPAVHTKVWVGVFFSNDSRLNKYRRFAYVKNPHQSFEFKCPIHTGLYEARIVDHRGQVLAKSESLNVVGI